MTEFLNSVELAAEDGWHVGFRDCSEGTLTKNPYPPQSTESSRWYSGYAQGYNMAQRWGKEKK